MKTLLILIATLMALATLGMLIFVFVIQNVETPAYRVEQAEGPFEVRHYPAMVVAEVRRPGPRGAALSAGFSPLARYIFAKDRTGDRVAMTAPVTQQAAQPISMTAPVTQARSASGDWTIRFIMPAAFSLQELPPPGASDVRLEQVPPQRVAALRFSGRTTDAVLAEREQELRDWIAERSLRPAASPTYAYYNDPFTPGFLRRNEVIIALAEG